MKTCTRCKQQSEDFTPKGTMCRGCVRRHNQEQYQKNKPAYKERASKWQAENRDHFLSLQAEYRKKNPDYHRNHKVTHMHVYERGQKRRTENFQRIPNRLIHGWWELLLATYDHRCCKCGSTEELTHDHVIPVSWFCSSHSLSNSQVLCKSCNSSKHKSWADYRNGKVLNDDGSLRIFKTQKVNENQ